jgi:hypothetical protein
MPRTLFSQPDCSLGLSRAFRSIFIMDISYLLDLHTISYVPLSAHDLPNTALGSNLYRTKIFHIRSVATSLAYEMQLILQLFWYFRHIIESGR